MIKPDWHIKENGGRGRLVGIASKSSNWFIAEEVHPRHADLISAAPDMLEALEECVSLLESAQAMYGRGETDEQAYCLAKSAIEKARGLL